MILQELAKDDGVVLVVGYGSEEIGSDLPWYEIIKEEFLDPSKDAGENGQQAKFVKASVVNYLKSATQGEIRVQGSDLDNLIDGLWRVAHDSSHHIRQDFLKLAGYTNDDLTYNGINGRDKLKRKLIAEINTQAFNRAILYEAVKDGIQAFQGNCEFYE